MRSISLLVKDKQLGKVASGATAAKSKSKDKDLHDGVPSKEGPRQGTSRRASPSRKECVHKGTLVTADIHLCVPFIQQGMEQACFQAH